MNSLKKEKPEILGFVQCKDNYIIMVYRIDKVLHFRIVGHVEPLILKDRAKEIKFGKDYSYEEQLMREVLSKKRVSFKKFSEFIVQPKGGRIIGIFRHPINDETVLRVIGFTNPSGLNDKYKELLASKGKPENELYWEFFGLGCEWIGNGITREKGLLSLSVLHSKSKIFEVEEVF